jgi:hypothetical protein
VRARLPTLVLEYLETDLMKTGKFKNMPMVVIIALCFATLTSVIFADSIAPPKAFAKSSPNGSHYFLMTPPKRDEWGDIVSFGEGKCFKVSDDGTSSMLWTTKGWHNPMIFLSDDGVHLASINYWPLGTELSPETVAIWFFRNGVAFKSVKVVDLIEEESNLLVSASHYQWLHNQINACNLFNQRLDIRTIEGKIFSFDIKSGEVMAE